MRDKWIGEQSVHASRKSIPKLSAFSLNRFDRKTECRLDNNCMDNLES